MESNERGVRNAERGKPITLVCFAVKEEAVTFRRFSTDYDGIEILIAGMGRRNSERELRKKLEVLTPSLVLTCGFAGALNPDLKIGDVLFEADANSGLAEELQAAGGRLVKFHCVSRVAVTVAEKTELRRVTGADAVEMESEIIRAICREKNIPGATVRAVSDMANEDLPLDFNAVMTEEQTISFSKLALALAKSPGSIPRLMQLQLNTRLAAQRLAEVLQKLLNRSGS